MTEHILVPSRTIVKNVFFAESFLAHIVFIMRLNLVDSRQSKPESAAVSRIWMYPDLAPMCLNQALADQQTKSKSRLSGRGLSQALESFENF